MNELWKDISGFNNGYRISSDGRVWSYKTKRYLKPTIDSDGYAVVGLFCDGRQMKQKVHRLVAKYFLNDDIEGKQINHKDEDKLNNNAANLEICDSSYNINYGRRNAIVSQKLSNKPPIPKKPIEAVDQTGNVVYRFDSLHDAERAGFNRSAITQVCSKKGNLKSYRGLDWRFV